MVVSYFVHMFGGVPLYIFLALVCRICVMPDISHQGAESTYIAGDEFATRWLCDYEEAFESVGYTII